MKVASIVGELQDLTLLILGLLGFVLVMVFRIELKALMRRLSGVEAQRGETRVGLTLAPGEAASEPASVRASEQIGASPEGEPESDEERRLEEGAENGPDGGAPGLRRQAFEALAEKDEARAKDLFERLRQEETDPIERKRDEVRWHGVRFLSGVDPTALKDLEAFADDEDVRFFAASLIGLCFNRAGEPTKAAAAYEQAASIAQTPEEQAQAVRAIALALQAGGDPSGAVARIEKQIPAIDEDEPQAELWRALATIYEQSEDQKSRALALQKASELRPNDAELRFKVAYAYSDVNLDGLSPLVLHYYEKALDFDSEHRWALNNTGVQLHALELPILGTEFYRAAVDQGNTLAMANVGYLYLRVGFLDEAQAIAHEASEHESPHENVARLTATLASAREEENKKFGEILRNGQLEAEFMSAYAAAWVSPTVESLAPAWHWDDGESVEASVGDGAAEVVWGGKSARKRLRMRFRGRAAEVAFEAQTYYRSSVTGDLKESGWSSDGSGFGYLEPDGRRLRIMRLDGTTPSFQDLIVDSADTPAS